MYFDSLDDDKSGSLEYKELSLMLRKGAGSEKAKANLKRAFCSFERDEYEDMEAARPTSASSLWGTRTVLPPVKLLCGGLGLGC